MKYHLSWVAAATLVIVGALPFHISAGAEEPPPVGLLPAEIAQWNQGLSMAGASPVDIGPFAERLRMQSRTGRDALRGQVPMPQFFAQHFRPVRQQQGA